jgi:uncharacterized protein (DUF849 family)
VSHTAIIMAAPNGARRTRADHPNLPVGIDDTIAEAARCHAAGATILHAHVRDDDAQHVLDPLRYQALFDGLADEVPDMLLQMTTEAVGRYTPQQQARCVYAVKPRLISMAVREMAGGNSDPDFARDFYRRAREQEVHVQHIVYDGDDLNRLFSLQSRGVIPGGRLCALFVLGRYLEHRESEPADIEPFLEARGDRDLDWFVCAFGSREHDCALSALRRGGHARVGFENNLLRPDGSLAENTAEQVAALRSAALSAGIEIADAARTREILGITA